MKMVNYEIELTVDLVQVNQSFLLRGDYRLAPGLNIYTVLYLIA
jgi:hypothetical protein